MQADLRQNLRADSGKPLAFHQLIRIDDTRWYWYQRYHHLLVDGFSFPAITRQIAAIYRAGRATLLRRSRLYPFADVVEEYQRYRQSEARQRDGAFWAQQRRELPPPASMSAAPLPGRSASADILRMKLSAPAGRFANWRRTCLRYRERILPGAGDVVAGAIMRANGLCRRIYLYAADGLGGVNGDRACPNVLPLAVNLHATEDLPTLAKRLAAQLKKMRRHQRYDAEQIVRDSGRAAGRRRYLARCST